MKRLVLALAVSVTAALALAPGASAAEYNCPGTFQVLHNDRIGSMQLPAGAYVITLLNENEVGCSEASRLFTQFLEDWDGRLPRPWVGIASSRTFTEGRGSGIGFRVTPTSNPPGPPHPPSSRVCPGYFTVLHNDRIGSFGIPKGRYHLILLSRSTRFNCAAASRNFTRFLQDWDGRLPRPWFLDPSTGSFMRGSIHIGFRIREYLTPGGNENGRHPRGQQRCPATFRVLNNDSIGRLNLRRGNYNVWVSGGLSCSGSTRLFASFLRRRLGRAAAAVEAERAVGDVPSRRVELRLPGQVPQPLTKFRQVGAEMLVERLAHPPPLVRARHPEAAEQLPLPLERQL